jgi:DNA-damage-inducible protein J
MANTTAVYARIDSNLKKDAEGILHDLGITPTSAIQMLYSQIVRTNSFPLDLHLSYRKPTAIGNMSRSELNAELEKGYSSIREGKTISSDEVDRIMKDEFNI